MPPPGIFVFSEDWFDGQGCTQKIEEGLGLRLPDICYPNYLISVDSKYLMDSKDLSAKSQPH